MFALLSFTCQDHCWELLCNFFLSFKIFVLCPLYSEITMACLVGLFWFFFYFLLIFFIFCGFIFIYCVGYLSVRKLISSLGHFFNHFFLECWPSQTHLFISISFIFFCSESSSKNIICCFCFIGPISIFLLSLST